MAGNDPYRTIRKHGALAPRHSAEDPFRLPMTLCQLFVLLMSFLRIGGCLERGWDIEGLLASALIVAIVALRVRG